MMRNPAIEARIIKMITAEPLSSTRHISRTLNAEGRSNEQAVRNALKALEYEGRIANVGEAVNAWRVTS
jgi:hypothetical protein